MGGDQSRSCIGDDQPGASTSNMDSSTSHQSSKKVHLNRRGNEIERSRASGDEGEEDPSDGESGGYGGYDSGKQRRTKPPLRLKKTESIGEDDEERRRSDEDEDQQPAAALNFNREYEAPNSPGAASAAKSSSPGHSKGPSEMEIGVLPMGDDEDYNEQLLGPGRQRNKGALGIGSPISPSGGGGIGEDLEEIDAEELRQFAFKTASAQAAERMDFEYELGELAVRLGADLKILTAGFDEAVMNVPHVRPTSSYKAYNLGPAAFGDPSSNGYGLSGYPEDNSQHGTRRPSAINMFLDETQNYGHEYQAESVPFTAEELLLQKAAANRRRRKIKVELMWLKQKKEAKALEREAQRKKEEAMEKSVNSKSGVSASSRKHSRRHSSVNGMPHMAPMKRTLAAGGLRSGIASPGVRSSVATGGMRSSLAVGSNRRSIDAPGGFASPRG